MMDTIDKIIEHLAARDMPLNRAKVEAKLARLGWTAEQWLAELQSAVEEINDPEYMKADPTGVVDMEKFSAPLSAHLVKDGSTD